MSTPILTLGMAVHHDFDGVWFTVDALRMYHREALKQCEIVIVDNAPEIVEQNGRKWNRLETWLASWVHDVPWKYVSAPEAVGTSAPRDRVFREASGRYVACMDCHVFLQPGGVQALLDYYAANPETSDLLSGPLYYDDLKTSSTHFSNVWGGGMLGRWATAWRCQCGFVCEEDGVQMIGGQSLAVFTSIWRERRNSAPLDAITPADVRARLGGLTACPKCGKGFPEIPHEGHEPHLIAAGFARMAEQREPFAIPAMGLGFFSCRKDAWIGFNPAFRGFGAEEWYVHEKFRKAGHQCLCLPQVGWVHRFGRPATATYPLRIWDKVRNYVIGRKELNLPLDDVKEHFVTGPEVPGNRLTLEQWEAILAGAEQPLEVKQNDGYSIAPNTAANCKSCGADSAQIISPAETIAAWYDLIVGQANHIEAHAPTLRRLAAGCDRIAEWGNIHGVSSVALLRGLFDRIEARSQEAKGPPVGMLRGLWDRIAGQENKEAHGARMTSYGTSKFAEADALTKVGGGAFEYRKGESHSVDLTEDVDLLYLDTVHTADRVYIELTRHAKRVKRYIALQGTGTYGEEAPGGGPGLLPGLRKFLRENPSWSVLEHSQQQYGLTVLGCRPEDKKSLPSGLRMAWNYTKAKVEHVATGSKMLPLPQVEARLDVCLTCDQRVDNRCSVCGCYLDEAPDGSEGRAMWPERPCPLGKWPV